MTTKDKKKNPNVKKYLKIFYEYYRLRELHLPPHLRKDKNADASGGGGRGEGWTIDAE